jgi:hypothetical protein
MYDEIDKARAAACDLRLALEGVCALLDELMDGLTCGEVDEFGSIARIQVLSLAVRSCLEGSITLDELLADL